MNFLKSGGRLHLHSSSNLWLFIYIPFLYITAAGKMSARVSKSATRRISVDATWPPNASPRKLRVGYCGSKDDERLWVKGRRHIFSEHFVLMTMRPENENLSQTFFPRFHSVVIIITIIKAFKTLRHKNFFFRPIYCLASVSTRRLCFSRSVGPIQSVSLWHRTIYTSEILDCAACRFTRWDDSASCLPQSRKHFFFFFAL